MKTFSPKPEDIKRQWHLMDASGKTLGRFSTQIARLLMGKHKPIYSTNEDTGDYVVVTNASKIRVTGKKAEQKVYYRHSGYPGGFRTTSLSKVMQDNPTKAIEHAVYGMIPHTHLGAKMKRRLKVYAGSEHPHNMAVDTSLEKKAE
jgi:large subunit ribosomal protein L13